MDAVAFQLSMKELVAGALSGGPAAVVDGGCVLNRVLLDQAPNAADPQKNVKPIGFVLETPNIPNELAVGFDPDNPLNGYFTDESFEKVLFIRGNDSQKVGPEATTISTAQKLRARYGDNISSNGCSIGAAALSVFEMTVSSGQVTINPFIDKEDRFLAIPAKTDPVNTDTSFPGIRCVFRELWIAPATQALTMFQSDRKTFNAFFDSVLANLAAVKQKLMSVVPLPNPKRDAIRQHIRKMAGRIGP